MPPSFLSSTVSITSPALYVRVTCIAAAIIKNAGGHGHRRYLNLVHWYFEHDLKLKLLQCLWDLGMDVPN